MTHPQPDLPDEVDFADEAWELEPEEATEGEADQ